MSDQRENVLAGLDALSSLDETSPEWPDLRNAVHWVVDDTWWDQRPPTFGSGEILANAEEVATIQSLLAALVPIVDEVQVSTSNSGYLQHPEWPAVRALAKHAASILREGR